MRFTAACLAVVLGTVFSNHALCLDAHAEAPSRYGINELENPSHSDQLESFLWRDLDPLAPSLAWVDPDPLVTPLQFEAATPLPAARQGSGRGNRINDSRAYDLFGSVDDLSGLSPSRRIRANSPAADAVFGSVATGRHTDDAGDLLKQAKSTHGVAVQNRSPLVSETRVRGQRVGQVLASGSYWAPARMDLDTMLNKLDSRLIENMILVKGPYSHRYGPGFRFVDVELLQSPRYQNGYELHGSSSVSFETNGQQWYGRQSVFGGDDDSGFFVSYGHKTGNDYETGQDGFFMPSSYKSRDLFVAYGKDISRTQSLEFNLLRLDQTDVEFPGLVFDLNFLVTDGYEVVYTDTAPDFADHFTAEIWYNRTRFEGDTLRPGKNAQQPFLVEDLFSPSGFDGFAVTDGDALSGGYRLESTYYQNDGGQISVGTDMIALNQELNDIEPLRLATENNFPIPRSHSVDLGVYAERVRNWSDNFRTTTGVRGDIVFTNATNDVVGLGDTVANIFDSNLQQTFALGAAYVSAEYDVDENRSLTAGAGYAQRQPTLTELYALGPFIGSLQRGRTFLFGDPQLDQEHMWQVDVGGRADYGWLNGGVHGYHSWIQDYITYDLFTPAGGGFGFPQGVALVNTELATLIGGEAYGQAQLTKRVSMFGIMSYVRGRDHTRRGPSRISDGERSGVVLPREEALPGINPLETRIGFLIEEPSTNPRWGVELSARVVDDQSRIAATLEEIATPGFTTYDIRTYYRKGDWLLTSGFENLTDKFYREHIDYRSGFGVFRPGISFYTGLEVTY